MKYLALGFIGAILWDVFKALFWRLWAAMWRE